MLHPLRFNADIERILRKPNFDDRRGRKEALAAANELEQRLNINVKRREKIARKKKQHEERAYKSGHNHTVVKRREREKKTFFCFQLGRRFLGQKKSMRILDSRR